VWFCRSDGFVDCKDAMVESEWFLNRGASAKVLNVDTTNIDVASTIHASSMMQALSLVDTLAQSPAVDSLPTLSGDGEMERGLAQVPLPAFSVEAASEPLQDDLLVGW
jgi:hypothetical protein